MHVRDFDTFYRLTRDACFRALVVATGSYEAGDLLAEAYARAWQRWEELADHPAPAAWVIRTALNLHTDWWRRRNRTIRLEWHQRHLPPPDLPVDPALLEALFALPKRQREVVALRVLMDLDTLETSRILGVATGTVTAHLHRALTKLRATLAVSEGSYE